MNEMANQSEAASFFLGVDGGGSKTLAIIVDAQGHERGRGLAGGANYGAVGIEEAIKNLNSAVAQATHGAGCILPLRAAWLGLAGIDRPADCELLLPFLRPFAEHIHLTNDAELVLSGLKDARGVALIAGTGSIALGRDQYAQTTRAGGWGHLIGDEGSGYAMGQQAIQAAVRAADGRGPMTQLLTLILHHWQLQKADDIIGQIYPESDKARIAQLSTLVLIAAQKGDRVARRIVREAANELALAMIAVSQRLDFSNQPVPLALGGGLLIHNARFRLQVLRSIRRQQCVEPVVLVDQPALSAARSARHLLAMNRMARP